MFKQYEIDTNRFLRAWLVVTGIFVLVVITIYAFAKIPTEPGFPQLYSTIEWANVEAAQTEQLTTYGSFDVDAATGDMVEAPAEGQEVVTRYHVPIERAKELIVQRGLPTREGAGTE